MTMRRDEMNMNIAWQDYIESAPAVLRGKPRFKGTRIPVSLILGYLAEGHTPEQLFAEFPDLRGEHIFACLVMFSLRLGRLSFAFLMVGVVCAAPARAEHSGPRVDDAIRVIDLSPKSVQTANVDPTLV